ncbi:hypothetical protein EOY70_01825 [Salmonella enterica]|nr:hypothetical protein [Salmonella enterica]EAP9337333.1 hypothetical protein [Salmonella enterica]ECH2788741.1 hypothetical protein [Salmonella enterica]EDJ5034035.1 hypothetical protein [Salmonella enterica]EFZ9607734.1 hypothetical protein [Salmonella enterica]
MKTPSYAVIKVNSKGEARITKQLEQQIKATSETLIKSWRSERRNARLAGMKYFRLRCISTDGNIWWVNPSHVVLKGVAFHINEMFSCRCCFPEWLFYEDDVAKAEAEIERRKATV